MTFRTFVRKSPRPLEPLQKAIGTPASFSFFAF